MTPDPQPGVQARPSRAATTPISTYRFQVRPSFGFDRVGALAGYLADLGVGHAYLSPVLMPSPGSEHGYDVVDHARLNPEAGGQAVFAAMVSALHERGLGAVADVVPNHMAVPTPVSLNAALWSVLRDGPGSPYARWFDVDWSVPSHALLMAVLGDRIGTVLQAGELTVDSSGPEPVLRYYDHVFPVRPGTADLPLEELVDRQWYRLAWWRVADDELNYRRFFDVDTLAAVRVEDPEVFDATHALLLQLVRDGSLDGLRIDHPDGLADPRGYLRRLAETTGGAWVVVEKILEGSEQLPEDWPCAGTTGYDALLRVGGLFVDPAGSGPLTSLLTEVSDSPGDFAHVVEQAKRDVVERGLYAEVTHLVDLLVQICTEDIALRDHPRRSLESALVELLVAFPRYRAYVVPGEPAPPEQAEVVQEAAQVARQRLPEEAHDALDVVVDLVLGRPVGRGPVGGRDEAWRQELIVRFQQTCGPVMAKGVEDTAFYRWHRLVALNEVGGDPERFGISPEEFHAYAHDRQRDWPATMTTLSTHDTKRSEDVRARLFPLSELTTEWSEAVRSWNEASAPHRSSSGWPDGATAYLVWQILVGTWDGGPLAADRLTDYLSKATREAKLHTTWTSPDPVYDEAVHAFATGVLADTELMASVGEFCQTLAPYARIAVLGQKLVQLTMPGIPDVYQGCELVDLSLVDPDNRRDVDFAARQAALRDLDAGRPPSSLSQEKLLVTATALRLRRTHPQVFGLGSSYAPVPTTTGNALAFARGRDGEEPLVVVVATRLARSLERLGGWGSHTLTLPEGRWRNLLGEQQVDGGSVQVADLLGRLPVALLLREEPGTGRVGP